MPKKAGSKPPAVQASAKLEKPVGRPYWSGQIKIALIYMPVHIYNAISRQSTIDLDLLYRPTGEHIHYANVLESGKVVSREDIVRGFKTDEGYVYLEKEDLNNVKLPSSDVLELTHFVDASALPFIFFEKPLYVFPSTQSAEEVYITLRDALLSSGKIGIGQLTVRGRERLCVLIPFHKGLAIELLHYHGEVRDPEKFFSSLPETKARTPHVKMAQELIEQLSGPLSLDQYQDHYRDAMMELIHSKKAHRQPHYKSAKPGPKNVINLMDALRKSLQEKKMGSDKTTDRSRKKA